MAHILESEGIGAVISGNTPFLLDDPATLIYVIEGQIDVFSVVRDSDGRTGPRRFLFSIKATACAIGAASGSDHVLLAVGAGLTKIRRVPMARIAELARKPDARALLAVPIRRFVKAISYAVSMRNEPRIDTLLAAGETAEIEMNQRAGPRDRTVWIMQETGSSLFAGMKGLAITTEFIALGKGLFIEATQNARIHAIDTETYLETDPAMSAIPTLLRFFMRWVEETSTEADAYEMQRLVARGEAEVRTLDRVLRGLTGLLDEADHGPTVEMGEPLLDACRAIGKAAGIEFKAPPKWLGQANASRVSDPVAEICRASRVRSRRIGLRGKWWLTDSGALLAFRAETKAPVALLPERGGYSLFDPSDGSIRTVDEAAAKSLEPFGEMFYRPLPARAITGKDLFSYGLQDMKVDMGTILWVSIASAILGLALPIANGQIFSSVIPLADPRQLWVVFIGLIVAGLSSMLFEMTRSFALSRVETRAGNNLQAGIVDRLLSLPVPFYRKYATGELVSRAMAINSIRSALSGIAITTALSSLTAVANFFLLFYYSFQLALVAVVVILVSSVFTMLVSWRAIAFDRVSTKIAMKISSLLFQMLGGLSKIRVAGAEGRAFAVWCEKYKESLSLHVRSANFGNAAQIFSDLLPICSTLALYAVTGFLMTSDKAHTIDTGSFIAFSSAYGVFIGSGSALISTFIGLIHLIPTMENAKPILEAVPEADVSKADAGELTGRIETAHISFRYAADGPLILDDVSFRAEPGEFIAFVGPSGSGKSTLLRMLLGFDAPATGVVSYDQQDLAQIDITGVRRQIGVVLQSSRLIAGSIFDNIVGASPLTLNDAWEAAESAGVADDIRGMPMGMQTVIGEGSSTISGGQRQRILIARAFVKKPRIIFFDEATSALDNRTQEIVTRSLDKIFATRIVIAHRLTTIQNATRIYVIDKGRVAQSGSFEELIVQEGLFKDLMLRQIV